MLIPSSKSSAQAVSTTFPLAVAAPAAAAAAAATPVQSQPWVSALTPSDLDSLKVVVTLEAEPLVASVSSSNYCGAAPSAPSDAATQPIPSDMEFFCQVVLADLPPRLSVELPAGGVLQLFRSTTDRSKGFARMLSEVSGTENTVAVAPIDPVALRVSRGVFTLDPALSEIAIAHPELNAISVDSSVQGFHESLEFLGYPVRMFGMGGSGIDSEQIAGGYERLFEFSPDGNEITGFYLPREDIASGRLDRIRVSYS
jgi:hypothetical protein